MEATSFNKIVHAKSRADAVNREISKYLAKQRKETLFLSRADFAKKVGVTVYIVAKWESPGYDFSISDLCKINSVIDIRQFIRELTEE